MNIFKQIRDFCIRTTESIVFKNTIVIIILINSIVLGLITSETIYSKFGSFLELILNISLIIFTIEILLRIIAKGWRFFLNGWNIFDLLLVAIAFLPESGAAITFRVFRVLRTLRIISSLKKLRHIVSAILISAPHVFWAAVLLMIIFYIFGIMGQNLFHEEFPQWFGTLGDTIYTLFQVTTLESWSMGIARPVMQVYPWAWMYFVPFVMVSSYIVLNVVVGVVVNATSDLSDDDDIIDMKNKMKSKKISNAEILDQINELKKTSSVWKRNWMKRSKSVDLMKFHKLLFLLLCFVSFVEITKAENDNYYIERDTLFVKEGITVLRQNDIFDYVDYHYISLPSTLKKIDESTFRNNKRLQEITIPNSVTYIGENAFENSSLTHIVLSDSITVLPKNIFKECSGLSEIYIPNSVTTIEDHAFESCHNLRHVKFPSFISKIGYQAFKDCSSLETVEWPTKIEHISADAFVECTNISKKGFSKHTKGKLYGFGWHKNTDFYTYLGYNITSPSFLDKPIKGITLSAIYSLEIFELNHKSTFLNKRISFLPCIKFDLTRHKSNQDNSNNKNRFFSTNLPLNVGFGNGYLDLIAGINLKYNFLAKSYLKDGSTINYFDMDGRHFQPGFNVGLRICDIFFYTYTRDFNNFIPDINKKNSSHNIGIWIPIGLRSIMTIKPS